MSPGSLAADFTVPLVGALMCSAPVASRPTVLSRIILLLDITAPSGYWCEGVT